MSSTLKIDVISDTVCPWCFVGKRNLDKALGQLKQAAPQQKVEVHWRPYLLSGPETWAEYTPEQLRSGVDKRAMYDKKFGPGRWLSFMPRLEAAFASAGVTGFTMDGLTGPTFDSHRLIWWAGQAGKQDALVEELFADYFTRGKPMCDHAVLVAAAERAGLQGAAEFLASGAGAAEVAEELQMGVRGRVTGVPHFVIAGAGGRTLAVSGAQPPDAFLDAFAQLGVGMGGA